MARHIKIDKYKPTLYGVGYMGEGKYKTTTHRKIKTTWDNMLDRCYSGRYPAYKSCSVYSDWHNFQNFAKWFEESYQEKWALDKDILISGNKIYGPETCCFIPQEINNQFQRRVPRGTLPSGVYSVDKKFYTTDYSGKKHYHLTVESAERFLKNYKITRLRELVEKYRELLSERVYNKLKEYVNEG